MNDWRAFVTGSYTTRLLTDRLDRALPPRHRLILACVVIWIVGGALAATIAGPRTTPAPLPAILIVATPTAHAPVAGRAAPPERQPAPTATPEPNQEPIAAATPEPRVITIYVERAQAEQPEPTPTYPAWYTDIPGASPELLAACAQEPARSSWVCGGQR